MGKKIKMILYGEPGVGKSVFASKFPNPFFVTTDGNYEWLLDFGAKEESHQRVNSWAEAKKLFKSNVFDKYETIVLDLTEDLFKWCEAEWCRRNEVEHPSDVGWGKGYEGTRNEFFIEISKLLNLDKHILLLMHGETITKKNKRGVEYNEYRPTSRIPEKLLDQLEGRVRYCLRCYIGAVEKDGKIIKNRYLSLVPKEDEYGIIRGVDENEIPHTILLDVDTFWNTVIGGEKPVIVVPKTETVKKVKPVKKVEEVVENSNEETTITVENKENIEVISEEDVKEVVVAETPVENNSNVSKLDKIAALKAKLNQSKTEKTVENTEVKEEPKVVQKLVTVKPKREEVVNIEKQQEVSEKNVQPEQPKIQTQAEKLAALKAKINSLKK